MTAEVRKETLMSPVLRRQTVMTDPEHQREPVSLAMRQCRPPAGLGPVRDPSGDWDGFFPSAMYTHGSYHLACSVCRSGRSPGEGNATHPIIFAWRIQWTEEPGGLQSMGSQRAGHN